MSRAVRTRSRCVLVGMVAVALTCGVTAVPPAASAAGRQCEVLLDEPAQAAQVAAAEPAVLAEAAEVNDQTVTELKSLARSDKTLWLGECGRAFYVEPARSATEPTPSVQAASVPKAVAPLTETFNLASNPASTKVIYLDFTGETVTGSAWNDESGTPIVAKPYSKDATVDTNFSDAELTDIQAVWQAVAEDYAPFDVNVTTKDPGQSGIDRSSSSDTSYGTRVVITDRTPYGDTCGCGGVAYLGVFDFSGVYHAYYQPAWVFTKGTTTNAKYIAEAVSHEAGHNLGLHHDGKDDKAYSTGAQGWAPIMGAGYTQPVSQWSKGEYAGATTTEDDVAIIAGVVGFRADDHGNTAQTATPITSGETVAGLISTRADVDAFIFAAAGHTTLSVASPRWLPNLDVSLTVLDAQANVVATSAPAMTPIGTETASGLDASWSVTLPASPGVYVALVDGAGNGNPAVLGGYSDYASLGAYTVALQTETDVEPLSLDTTPLPSAKVGVAYSSTPVVASGGIAPYTFAAGGLPSGLSIGTSTGTIQGTPKVDGAASVLVSVTDAAGRVESATLSLTVAPAAVVAGAPTAPKSVTAKSGDRQVTLSWQPSSANGSPVTKYTITSTPGGIATTVSGGRTSATVKGLATNTAYTFTVVARNGIGVSPAAAIKAKTSPGEPEAPRIKSAKSGTAGGKITGVATWSAPTHDSGAPITYYKVVAYRYGANGKVVSKTVSPKVSASKRSYTMKLPSKGKYGFTLVAYNNLGKSKPSALSNRINGR